VLQRGGYEKFSQGRSNVIGNQVCHVDFQFASHTLSVKSKTPAFSPRSRQRPTPPPLNWNGTSGSNRDTTTASWLNSASAPVWSNSNRDITAADITFNNAGYTLASDALTFSIGITTNGNAPISSAISSAAAMMKFGAVTLTLSGNKGSMTCRRWSAPGLPTRLTTIPEID